MSTMTKMVVRVGGSVLTGTLAFAAGIVVLLLRMPRPPVPPSYAATLLAAAGAAVGFSFGTRLGERFTRCRPSSIRLLCAWYLAACAGGATLLYPWGGMLAGFGIMGFGGVTAVVWELLRWRSGSTSEAGH